ncbi:unnamed protein product [Protopolystoma xenopodis]|uniref:Tubulin/FtsZ GTPase domain-containing protein n=1 Tax=Protopolystoma xenopodis TaxID=117903 RepID=A0A448WKS1_9PLAT|nr:unnamed protein product [Protopolystoma xenopodis]
MGREIMLVHIGQAGVQMGSALWELFCLEHQLSPTGQHSSHPKPGDGSFNELENMDCLFYETKQAYVPRAIMVDLERNVIEDSALAVGNFVSELVQFWCNYFLNPIDF